MFLFVIAGVRPRVFTRRDGRSCPACGEGVLHVEGVDHWFTLFFVPLFPVSRGRRTLRCGRCGALYTGAMERLGPPGPGRRGATPGRGRKACQDCGRIFEEGFSYCPYCGRPAER